jgi:hypothetical protein
MATGQEDPHPTPLKPRSRQAKRNARKERKAAKRRGVGVQHQPEYQEPPTHQLSSSEEEEEDQDLYQVETSGKGTILEIVSKPLYSSYPIPDQDPETMPSSSEEEDGEISDNGDSDDEENASEAASMEDLDDQITDESEEEEMENLYKKPTTPDSAEGTGEGKHLQQTSESEESDAQAEEGHLLKKPSPRKSAKNGKSTGLRNQKKGLSPISLSSSESQDTGTVGGAGPEDKTSRKNVDPEQGDRGERDSPQSKQISFLGEGKKAISFFLSEKMVKNWQKRARK